MEEMIWYMPEPEMISSTLETEMMKCMEKPGMTDSTEEMEMTI